MNYFRWQTNKIHSSSKRRALRLAKSPQRRLVTILPRGWSAALVASAASRSFGADDASGRNEGTRTRRAVAGTCPPHARGWRAAVVPQRGGGRPSSASPVATVLVAATRLGPLFFGPPRPCGQEGAVAVGAVVPQRLRAQPPILTTPPPRPRPPTSHRLPRHRRHLISFISTHNNPRLPTRARPPSFAASTLASRH